VNDPGEDPCRSCGHERAWHYSTCIASILKCANIDCDATECGHDEGCYTHCECEAFVEPPCALCNGTKEVPSWAGAKWPIDCPDCKVKP
jgi:hypothetical protein